MWQNIDIFCLENVSVFDVNFGKIFELITYQTTTLKALKNNAKNTP